MKFLSLICLLLVLLQLSSCGDGDDNDDLIQEQTESTGTNGGQTTTKNLFSSWRRTDGRIMDLSGSDFNRWSSFRFDFNLGSSCTCRMKIIGSQTNGTFTLSNCLWNFDGPGDPDCTANHGTSSYRKSGSDLRWSCALPSLPSPCGKYN